MISALLSAQVQTSPHLDADNVEQAMSIVAVEIRMIEEMRLYCGAGLPQSKRIADYHALLWTANNEQELEAVEAYLSTRNRVKYDAKLAPFIAAGVGMMKSAGDSALHGQICTGMMEQIKSGERNIGSRTPQASAFLKAYLKTHSLAEPEAGKRNMYLGCVKQSFNKGIDLDDAQMMCKCMLDVMYKDLTKDELAEFDRTSRENGDVSSLPSIARVQSKLSDCQSTPAQMQ
jgi:hypothetical protein